MKVSPRVHLKQSDVFCDQPRILVIARAAKRPVDVNATAGKNWDFALHWPDGPRKNGYRYIWTGKRNRKGREIRRRMTEAELKRPVDQWVDAQVLRWRKTLEPTGSRREHPRLKAARRQRPRTVAEMARRSRVLGVTIGWELKSRAYGTNPALAARFKRAASAGGAKFFVMTLANMAHWREKMKNFHDVGVETLILTRGKRPADWARVSPFITHKGTWR